jgi:hypothetical protein
LLEGRIYDIFSTPDCGQRKGHIVARKTRKSKTAADERVFLIVAVDAKTVLIAPAMPAIEDAKLAAKVRSIKPKRGAGVQEFPRVLVVTGASALASNFGTLNPSSPKPGPGPGPK